MESLNVLVDMGQFATVTRSNQQDHAQFGALVVTLWTCYGALLVVVLLLTLRECAKHQGHSEL